MRDRILVLTGSYFPEIGGGELLNQRHARLLTDAGFDVNVFVPRIDESPGGIDALGTRYVTTERWNFGGYRLIPPDRMRREIERYAPSLIYLMGPNPHDVYALRIARRHRIPVALLYHADFRSDRLTSRLATRAYASLATRGFDAIVVTTQAYAARIRERGVPERRIAYVGMGVDAEFFVPRAEYAPRTQPPQLLFVGRLDANHTYKRLDLLLAAVAALRERGVSTRLTVVGDGDRRAEFERLAGELGLADAVVFRGQIDDEGLRDAYRDADLLVLPSPSASEGFGLVVLEAYASGCPVVTNRAAGSSEVVAASGCGALWEGEHARDLAAAIETVLTDGTPRAAVAAKARAFVEEHHAWQAVGARLGAALSQAIEDRRAAEAAQG